MGVTRELSLLDTELSSGARITGILGVVPGFRSKVMVAMTPEFANVCVLSTTIFTEEGLKLGLSMYIEPLTSWPCLILGLDSVAGSYATTNDIPVISSIPDPEIV